MKKWLSKALQFDYCSLSIATFWAALLVYFFASNYSIDLINPDAYVGIATFNGVDVSKRISMYYRSVFLFIAAFLAIRFLWFQLAKSLANWLSTSLFYTSLGGVLILAAHVLGAEQIQALYVLLLIQLSLLLIAIQSFIVKEQIIQSANEWLVYLISSYSIAYTVEFVLAVTNNKSHFLLDIGIALILQVFWLKFAAIFRHYFWLICANPIFALVAFELSLGFNQRGLNFNSSIILYVFILIIAWFISKSTKVIRYNSNRGLPYFLFFLGYMLDGIYTPIMQATSEMFEIANQANGIMRTVVFGELPFIHYFSSHVGSDLIQGFVYTLINGYEAAHQGFNIYQKLPIAFAYPFIFLVFNKIFKSVSLSLALVFLFPFSNALYPLSFWYAFTSILIINQVYNYWSKKWLLYLFFWTLFLIIWRIDVAVATIASTALVLAPSFIVLPQKSTVYLFKLLAISLVAILVVFIISQLSTDVDLWVQMRQALDYLGAAQAHAYTRIGEEGALLFRLHHFVFPLLMALVAVYYSFKLLQGKTSILYISIAYLAWYTIFNAQRGLVRHGFVELTDRGISAFLFLVIFLVLIDVFKTLPRIKQISMALIATFLLIATAKFINIKGEKSLLKIAEYDIREYPNLNYKHKIQRITDNPKLDDKYKEFCQYVNTHLSDNQTFIDVANVPMLYFYSQKRVPSYFNQYMQNTVTEYLQEANIDGFKNFDLPLVVFSMYPKNWWNYSDAVPGSIRYNKTIAYIYKHYEPFIRIGNYNLWKQKGAELPSLNYPKAQENESDYHLKYYPMYLAAKLSKLSKTIYLDQKQLKSNETYTIDVSDINASKRHENYLLLTFDKPINGNINLQIVDANGNAIATQKAEFNTKMQSNQLAFPVSANYSYITKAKELKLQWNDKDVQLITLKIVGI